MSLLDRAFVKAYTRSHAPSPRADEKRDSFPVEHAPHLVPDQGLAAQLSPVQDAVAWGDLSDVTYFRVDVGHVPSPRANVRATTVATPVIAVTGAQAVQSPVSAKPVHSPERYLPEASLQETRLPSSMGMPASQYPERPAQTHRTLPPNPSAMSHTLTAYDAAPAEMEEAAMQVRIDEPHLKRVWTPPVVEEPQEYFRTRRNPEESAEFARAKMESLAQENLKAAGPQSASFASQVSTAAIKAARNAERPSATAPMPSQNTASRRRAFEPLWEVDAFDFSDTIVELFGDAKLMKSIGAPLDEAVSNGLRSILITSAGRGAGRTSVAIGIAVSAAAAGLRVALVDADTCNAGIADALRLEVADGWPSAIQNGLPLDEVAIRSIEDQFVVIPTKIDSLANPTQPAEFDYLINRLRDAFDLVLVDGSAWCDDSSLSQSQLVDAAIMVVDARNRDIDQEAEMQNDLRRAGVAGLGIVENFA